MVGMRQAISSNVTVFYKYVFPVFWIGLFGYGVLSLLMGRERWASVWLLALFWLAGVALTLWLALRLKYVSVDERFVYAFGYARRAQIPLSDIAGIEESSGLKPKQITLRLRSPSPMGRKIVFIPELRAFEMWRVNHPVVAELGRRIKAELER